MNMQSRYDLDVLMEEKYLVPQVIEGMLVV